MTRTILVNLYMMSIIRLQTFLMERYDEKKVKSKPCINPEMLSQIEARDNLLSMYIKLCEIT